MLTCSICTKLMVMLNSIFNFIVKIILELDLIDTLIKLGHFLFHETYNFLIIHITIS